MSQPPDLHSSTEEDEPTPKTTAPGHVSNTMDLLHPLTSLTWEHCHKPPWGKKKIMPAQCAALQDRVAVLCDNGYGTNVVYTSSIIDLHSWTETELPYEHMSLTIYQSKFVVVGGRDRSTDEATNTILTSTTGRQWEPSLPPMPTKRESTSSASTTSPEVLVVAGGTGSGGAVLNIVEVLMADKWITIDPLPKPARYMVSVVHEGKLYFMTRVDTPNIVTTCSCTSLISSTDSSRTSSTNSPLWSQFPAPGGRQSIVFYSTRLVTIDPQATARVYFSTTQSWVEASIAGDISDGDCHVSPATVLPTGEILYCRFAGGVYRGRITVSSYSPDMEFPRNVLTRLEAVMGIQIVSVLAKCHTKLTSSSGVELQPRTHHGREIALPDANTEPAEYVEEVILQWSARRSHCPTWRQLLTVLQDIGLVDLSQQIQEFMEVRGSSPTENTPARETCHGE